MPDGIGVVFVPWVRDGGARVYRLPGVYRRLLESKCRFETQPDPRDWLVHEDRDELARAKVDAAERAAAMFEEQLQAGEPFTVAGTILATCTANAVRWVPSLTLTS